MREKNAIYELEMIITSFLFQPSINAPENNPAFALPAAIAMLEFKLLGAAQSF